MSSADPERWTNIPLLVKIFKLIINELSTVMESNASRANAADWSQGESAPQQVHRVTSRPHFQLVHKEGRAFLTPFRYHGLNYNYYFYFIFLTRLAVFILPDSSGMWEDNDVEDGEDGEDEDEDEGLAGQLLSDLIASNKYGTSRTQLAHRSFVTGRQLEVLSLGVPALTTACFAALSQMTIITRTTRRTTRTP